MGVSVIPIYSSSLVHALTFLNQIKDYPAFLSDLAQTLRPGGMLVLGDGEMQLYDELRRPLAYSETDASWTQKLFFAGYNAMKNRGGHIDCPTMNPTWLRSIGSLTDVGWDKVFIPIGPWIYGEKCSTNFVQCSSAADCVA